MWDPLYTLTGPEPFDHRALNTLFGSISLKTLYSLLYVIFYSCVTSRIGKSNIFQFYKRQDELALMKDHLTVIVKN